MAGPLRAAAAAALLALAACGGGGAGPPDTPPPTPPAPGLAGASVMLFPVQSGVPLEIEGELGFWLADRAARTEWVGPADLRAAVARTPGWRLDLDALPPGVVESYGQKRLRDPLYGIVRRLSALIDARLAFIPFARPVADSGGATVELTGVLVDAHGGRVLWMGTVRGERAAPGEPMRTASAAEALARALVP